MKCSEVKLLWIEKVFILYPLVSLFLLQLSQYPLWISSALYVLCCFLYRFHAKRVYPDFGLWTVLLFAFPMIGWIGLNKTFAWLWVFVFVCLGCMRLSGALLVPVRFRFVLFFDFLKIVVVLSFFWSGVLTYLGHPLAPDFYPWSPFLNADLRLLLVSGRMDSGQSVGHSYFLWFCAFLLCWVLFDGKSSRVWWVVLPVFLLFTRARIAFLCLFYVFVCFVFFRVGFLKRFLSVFQFCFPFFLAVVMVAVPVLSVDFGGFVPDSLKNANGEVFSGRDYLNQALAREAMKAPVFGLGVDADVLILGVDDNGDINYSDRVSAAASESGLRFAVKFGVPFYVAFLFFLIFVMYACKVFGGALSVSLRSVFGVFFMTAMTEGVFEQPLGFGLLLFVLSSWVMLEFYRARLRVVR